MTALKKDRWKSKELLDADIHVLDDIILLQYVFSNVYCYPHGDKWTTINGYLTKTKCLFVKKRDG